MDENDPLSDMDARSDISISSDDSILPENWTGATMAAAFSGSSPDSLLILAADQCIHTLSPQDIAADGLPGALFEILVRRALLLRAKQDMVSHLLAQWPSKKLVLGHYSVTVPQLSPREKRIANSCMTAVTHYYTLVDALLRLHKYSRLKTVVLSDTFCENFHYAKIRVWCQLPMLYLRHFSVSQLGKLIKDRVPASFMDVDHFLDNYKVGRPLSFDITRLPGSEPVTVVMPLSINWLGKGCNYHDIAVFLSLLPHVPFQFHFSEITISNVIDFKMLETLLQLYTAPEKTKGLSIVFRDRCESVHVMLILSTLRNTLKKFINLELFHCEFTGVYVNPNQNRFSHSLDEISSCVSHWKHLRQLDLPGNSLYNQLNVFKTLENPLSVLDLGSTELFAKDIQFIADSRHAASLEELILNCVPLSDNDMQHSLGILFSRLRRVQLLCVCDTNLNHEQAIALVKQLANSRRLSSLRMALNRFGTIEELSTLVEEVAKNIVNLSALQCINHTSVDSSLGEIRKLNNTEYEQLKELAGGFKITIF